MGLIVMWINFVPLYGPALSFLDLASTRYSLLFLATHICGLLGSSYYLASQDEPGSFRIINSVLPVILALLTAILLIDTVINTLAILIAIFLSLGLLSGWIVSRWMCWFLSDLTVGRRGSVFGKSLAVTYVLISLSTIVLTSFTAGIKYAFIASSLVILVGGQFVSMLPLPNKKSQPLIMKDLIKIIPPIPLIIFAFFGYSVVALTYSLITSWSLKEPVLPWLLIIPYALIGLLLGPYSDRAGRHIFYILAFLCTGLGILILTVAADQPFMHITTGLLVNSGLLFVHLYYWLSLADYQDPRFSPLSMAIGVSIELAIFSASYLLVNYITGKPSPIVINVGLTGVSIILIGFAIVTWITINSYSRLNNLEKGNNMAFTIDLIAGDKLHNPAAAAYYINTMGKDKYVDIIVTKYQLTKKEAEISFMLSAGFSNSDINSELLITANTLKYHLKNIYSKLGVTSRGEAKKKLQI